MLGCMHILVTNPCCLMVIALTKSISKHSIFFLIQEYFESSCNNALQRNFRIRCSKSTQQLFWWGFDWDYIDLVDKLRKIKLCTMMRLTILETNVYQFRSSLKCLPIMFNNFLYRVWHNFCYNFYLEFY